MVHKNDDVIDIAGGDSKYSSPHTTNYTINEKDIPLKGGVESHTEIYKSEKFTDFLKNHIPTMRKAPKPDKLNKSKSLKKQIEKSDKRQKNRNGGTRPRF